MPEEDCNPNPTLADLGVTKKESSRYQKLTGSSWRYRCGNGNRLVSLYCFVVDILDGAGEIGRVAIIVDQDILTVTVEGEQKARRVGGCFVLCVFSPSHRSPFVPWSTSRPSCWLGARPKPPNPGSRRRSLHAMSDEHAILRLVPAKKLRILVVEDDTDARAYFGVVLTHLGQEPHLCVDSDSAIEISKSVTFDVLLADVRLHRGTCWDLIEALRSMYRVPPRIVTMSVWNVEEYAERSRAMGTHAHLLKPFGQAELMDALGIDG